MAASRDRVWTSRALVDQPTQAVSIQLVVQLRACATGGVERTARIVFRRQADDRSPTFHIGAETAISGRLAARDLVGILGQENPVAAIAFGRGAGDEIVVADKMDSGAGV